MEFPHDYFDDEIREDFYVSGLMKRVWAANLEVISDIAKVCEKHNIRWFADYGTLLGAIRHGGCIPWDDDFDICMLRDDYMRFLEVAEQELPDNYSVLNCHNEYDDLLTRVVNNRHPIFEDDLLEKYHQCFIATGIDIFPLDYMAPTKEEQEAHKLLLKSMINFQPILEDPNLDREVLNQVLAQLEQLCGKKFDKKGNLVKQLLEAAEGASALYGPEGTDTVMLAYVWAKNGTKTYPLSIFQNAVKVKYEGVDLWISAEYDKMLRIEYGDYMRIIKGGASHSYPCFAGQEEHVRDAVSDYPFLYSFDKKDLEEAERLPKQGIKAACTRFCALMRNAHKQIGLAISGGNAEGAFSLFQSCQNAAIGIGTMLEEQYGEGYFLVSYLEQYCEAVYQASENVGAYVSASLGDVLDEVITQFKHNIEKIEEKKEILIVPYRASSWGNIEAIWREATEDKDCHVTVIVPPYYEKNALGGFLDMHDESGMLPDYVEVTAYDAYDFEKKHPDVIYTQNPYDECNYTTSVHPFFYARNLKKYTDKLVYIPWFTMKDVNPANGKVHQTMQYFVTVPGVVLADEVILPNDSVRDAYIERLVEMAGEDTRTVWEEKLAVKEIPIVDTRSVQVYDRIPDIWKRMIECADGSRKPIVLYDISAAAFVQSEERAIEKLSDTLSFFESKKDEVAFIWRKNEMTEDVLSNISSRVYERYRQILDCFIERGWGIYDDVLSYTDEALLADAYYGDAGFIPRRFEMMGKPVLLQYIKPEKQENTTPVVRMTKNGQGDYPFHIRAYAIVDELMYFIPDELNLLCTMRLADGEIEILSSVPEEKLNQIELALKLEYYDEKIIVVPYMAKTPWIYDVHTGNWKKISISNREQSWKYVASEVYGDKLYMFPLHYKYITRVDLKTHTVTYLKEIYNEFCKHQDLEQCNLSCQYTRKQDTLYLVEQQSNMVLRFDLMTEAYAWMSVGYHTNIYNAIASDDSYFYLVPLHKGNLVRWDGKNEYKEYALPKECQYDECGPVDANIINGKLVLQGYNCDTIVYDLSDLNKIHTEPIRYEYAYKLREDCFTGHDRRTQEFVIQDNDNCRRYQCVFNQTMLIEYINREVEVGRIGLSGQAMTEDAVVEKSYLVKCLLKYAGQREMRTEKKTVVFLPYKASMWDSLESIWIAAKEDERCETYVVPIPYYDKDAKGNLTDYHHEGAMFPSYVPITDYRIFDLKSRRVDVIYIHNPYDEGNHVTSVDPDYYSAELKKHARKLVYVPYYATSGGMSEAQSLCRAYLNADYIIVQAEGHKDYFDSVVPREKLLALGSPKFDRVINLCRKRPDVPDEWQEKIAGKTVYFFNTSLGGMLADTEAFLKKLRYVFACFAGKDDVCLIWRPHPLLDTTFASARSQYQAEYELLKRYYMEENVGVYDTTPDIDKTIALSDAYIGDSGTSVTALFGIVGKPVYILNNTIHRIPGDSDWKKEMIALFYRQGQKEWMVTAGNQLYHSSLKHAYKYEYYCDLSEYASGWYYRLAIERNQQVFVFPANAQDILVIEADKKIRKIELEETTGQPGAFANVWFYKQYAFLIPYKYQYIVRFDMDTYAVDYVDGCREFLVSEHGNGDRIGGSCIWNGYLLLASPNDKKIFALDCGTLSLQMLAIDAKYYRGACALQEDGDSVWLLPSTGTNVVRWRPDTGETTTYNCRVSDFACHNAITRKQCMELAFGSLAVSGDTVILAPFWGNQFVRIDKENGTVDTFKTDINFQVDEDNSYCSSSGNGTFLGMLDGRRAFFYHETGRKLYLIDLQDGNAQSIEIEFDEAEVKTHAPGFSKCSKWIRYGCEERAICSLEHVIKHTGYGKAFDKEACLAAYREIAEHADGSSGEAIHAYVMNQL